MERAEIFLSRFAELHFKVVSMQDLTRDEAAEYEGLRETAEQALNEMWDKGE